MTLLRGVARVIKGEPANVSSSAANQQFLDLQRQSQELIEQAQQQVRDMLHAATTEANAIRKAAHEQGYAEGIAAAQETLAAEIETRAASRSCDVARRQLKPFLQALTDSQQRLERARNEWIERWETDAIMLSAQIAERILTTEIEARPELALGKLRSALSLASGLPVVAIHVSPDDADLFRLPELQEQLASGCRLVVNETMTRGDIVIDLPAGQIDARAVSQIQGLVSELIGA